MKDGPRFFYHSFPRPRQGETHNETATRGWAILQSMTQLGLVLAPEVVEWLTPVSLGTPSPIQILQRRVCFTELSQHELSGHSTRFGPFALEFETNALRRVGALPVIYMPQALSEKDHLALLGPFVAGHLGQIRGTLEKLNLLANLDNPAYVNNLGSNTVPDDCMINLRNGDEARGTVQEFQIPWNVLRDLLSFIGFETAPFNAMIGATSIAQALFYPTDDDHHDEELGYYRQREWRITADYYVNGSPRGRSLEDEEKKLLLALDASFWGANTDPSKSISRVDEALTLVQPTPTELLEMITRIIVPDNFFDQAHQIFGDHVAAVSWLEQSN
jgi:hypothetical protein